MTTSNEPGYYEEGNFGIRIENVCIVVPANTPYNFNDKEFLTLQDVTMTPISKDLMNMSLLNESEKAWINKYHATVRQNVSPLIQQYFPEAMEYLIQETLTI
jgi:Xaa-Pro aminopeptidase